MPRMIPSFEGVLRTVAVQCYAGEVLFGLLLLSCRDES